MTQDIRDLIAEAREWAGSYASWGDNGLVDRLADALEVSLGERDAAVAAIERVRELHQVDEYTAGHTIVRCECEEIWPCSTVAALDGAPEPEGKRWFAACWRDDNGTQNCLESATIVREYAEADVKRWRDQEQREPNGQPDRVVLATKISYPWLPVEGESKP